MEGVPLINPTIDPRAAPVVEPEVAAIAATVPEGLSPVRPVEPSAHVDPTDATVVDLGPAESAPIAVPSSEPAAPDPVRPVEEVRLDLLAPSQPDEEPSPAKVDGRRRVEDPTLFPVDDSVAPVKPGTVRAEYEDWNDLINSIARDRTAVARTEDARGRMRYDVPALSPEGQRLLETPRFAKRTTARLASIEQSQRREIDRLVRWITTQGHDPAKLIIEGRTARIGVAPDSVRRLMRDWRVHPDVVAAMRAENDRRIEAGLVVARDAARVRVQPAPAVVETGDAERRRAQVVTDLPAPEDAATRQVAELIRRLRDAESPQRIQEAADAVAADPIAREDVHRHRVELSRAYNSALTDDDVRTSRDRDRRGGR